MRIEVGFPENRKVSARVRQFEVMTDQPKHGGGDDTAPSPFELFLASLGTCAGIYVKGFCMQRGISMDGMRIIQEAEPGGQPGMVGKIRLRIEVPPDFPKQYENALIQSASLCAVKKHMETPPEFEITVEARDG